MNLERKKKFVVKVGKRVLTECDGLPLVVVTVAGCMRGISDPILWENALNELRGCIIRSTCDMEDKVYGCLRFSYDHLRQIDQDCFLCCALYPEDCEIEKEEIIEYWMEEGLIDEMGTRKAMQVNGHSILQKLEENCLLERVGKESTHIKMHDVVRDMALHITRKRFLVKAGKQLNEIPNVEEWSEDLEKVSFMRNHISTIPRNMNSPKFRKLTTLLLSENSLEEIPDSFFEHTPILKILDLSANPVVNLPNSISNLEKLTALLLHGCDRINNLPSLSKLQALKKLDLEGTSIWKIPQGLEMLENLRYLNLGFTNYLKEIPNGLLSKLCRLQYLAMHPASARAEEMMELSRLEVFEGRFSNVRDFSMYATQSRRLHNYLICVGNMLNDYNWLFQEYRNMDYDKIVACKFPDINSGDGIMLPHAIQVLRLEGLTYATDLKECDELESIFSLGCQVDTLERLELSSLKNLKGIVGELSVGKFSSLKELHLSFCGKIKNLFSAKRVLHKLEVISVLSCFEIEEIIASEDEGMGTNNNTIKYTLPKLRKLELLHLRELKSICSKNGVMVCDSLQEITIWNCPKLKRIPLYLPQLDLDKGKPSPPPSLKKIEVFPDEWWESVEWDLPDAKNVLLPFLNFWDSQRRKWKQAIDEVSLKA